MSDYKVEEVDPNIAAELMKKYSFGPNNKTGRRSIVFPGGFEIKGEFSLVAREISSNAVAWEHSEENLLTDYGRRVWFDNHFAGSIYLGFTPDTRIPNTNRCASTTDSTQSFVSTAITPTNTPATHTKSFLFNFVTPPVSNRTLGSIYIHQLSAISINLGPAAMIAYTQLTPSRVQTTTQTLEVLYKISMSPIY